MSTESRCETLQDWPQPHSVLQSQAAAPTLAILSDQDRDDGWGFPSVAASSCVPELRRAATEASHRASSGAGEDSRTAYEVGRQSPSWPLGDVGLQRLDSGPRIRARDADARNGGPMRESRGDPCRDVVVAVARAGRARQGAYSKSASRLTS